MVADQRASVYDFREATRKGCAGSPVAHLRTLLRRVADKIGQGETAEIILDITKFMISPDGVRNIASAAGLAVERITETGFQVLSVVVKRQ